MELVKVEMERIAEEGKKRFSQMLSKRKRRDRNISDLADLLSREKSIHSRVSGRNFFSRNSPILLDSRRFHKPPSEEAEKKR